MDRVVDSKPVQLIECPFFSNMALECVSKYGEMQFRMDLTAFQGAFPQL